VRRVKVKARLLPREGFKGRLGYHVRVKVKARLLPREGFKGRLGYHVRGLKQGQGYTT
jgi:hypothetical protein